MPQKIGRRLILNDGTTLENAEAGYADQVLWCYIPGLSIVQAFPLFSDAQKTQRITFEFGEMSEVYEGFTVISAIIQGEDKTRISLRKDNANV